MWNSLKLRFKWNWVIINNFLIRLNETYWNCVRNCIVVQLNLYLVTLLNCIVVKLNLYLVTLLNDEINSSINKNILLAMDSNLILLEWWKTLVFNNYLSVAYI